MILRSKINIKKLSIKGKYPYLLKGMHIKVEKIKNLTCFTKT
jgi:hypothetical protein